MKRRQRLKVRRERGRAAERFVALREHELERGGAATHPVRRG
jgi:hypothetical protein